MSEKFKRDKAFFERFVTSTHHKYIDEFLGFEVRRDISQYSTFGFAKRNNPSDGVYIGYFTPKDDGSSNYHVFPKEFFKGNYDE